MCYKQYLIGSCIIIFGTLLEQIYLLNLDPFSFMYLYICLGFLDIVICIPSFLSHVFLVYTSVICHSILFFYNGHIV